MDLFRQSFEIAVPKFPIVKINWFMMFISKLRDSASKDLPAFIADFFNAMSQRTSPEPVTYIFTFLRSPPYHEDESSSRNHKYPEKNTHLWLCKMGFRCSFLVDSPPILHLQEQFVDIWLALKSILDLVDIVDGMVELHRLMLSETWSRMGLKICRSNLLLTWGERRLGGARDDREAGEGWGGCWYTKMRH